MAQNNYDRARELLKNEQTGGIFHTETRLDVAAIFATLALTDEVRALRGVLMTQTEGGGDVQRDG